MRSKGSDIGCKKSPSTVPHKTPSTVCKPPPTASPKPSKTPKTVPCKPPPKGKKGTKARPPKRNWSQRFIKPLLRPIRIVQFLVVLLIFALVIYTTALGNDYIPSVTCILLTVLSGVYVLVLAIDVISQLGGGEIRSIPMFIFSLLGAVLFGIAGVLLLAAFSDTSLWYLWTILGLSLIACVLFLIDIITALIFWRQNCECCKDRSAKQMEVLYQKHGRASSTDRSKTVKYDLTTSVSSIQIPPCGDEESAPDHSRRKIGYGRRRQYVDRPSSARSKTPVRGCDIQTESSTKSNIHSQTHRDIKEKPVQTVSKCELCNRQIPVFSTLKEPAERSGQQPPYTTCPALMQLFRGDRKIPPQMKTRSGTITKLTLASYCVTPNQTSESSCQTSPAKSTKSIRKSDSADEKKIKIDPEKKEKEVPQKLSELEKERVKTTSSSGRKVVKPPLKKPPESPKMKPTKLKKKRSEVPPVCDSRSGEEAARCVFESSDDNETVIEEILMARSICENKFKDKDVVEEMLKKEAEKIEETEDACKDKIECQDVVECKVEERPPETRCDMDENISKDLVPLPNKQLILLPKQMAEVIERLEEIKGNIEAVDDNKTDQNKVVIDCLPLKCTDSMPNVDICIRKSIKDLHKTGSSEMGRLSAHDQPKPNKMHKPEKVERASESVAIPHPHTGTQTPDDGNQHGRNKRTYVFAKKNKVEPAEVRHADTDVQMLDNEAQTESSCAEKRISQGKGDNVCLTCKKPQIPTTSPVHYYNVYRDIRGRTYCEFCATPNSIKVLYKNSTEQKRMKCAGCGNFIRMKHSYNLKDEIGFRSKVENCPGCGQIQLERAPLASA